MHGQGVSGQFGGNAVYGNRGDGLEREELNLCGSEALKLKERSAFGNGQPVRNRRGHFEAHRKVLRRQHMIHAAFAHTQRHIQMSDVQRYALDVFPAGPVGIQQHDALKGAAVVAVIFDLAGGVGQADIAVLLLRGPQADRSAQRIQRIVAPVFAKGEHPDLAVSDPVFHSTGLPS